MSNNPKNCVMFFLSLPSLSPSHFLFFCQVIAYMTLGIDVSRLFSEMVMACNTNDLIVKKMVYQYLTTYAQSNPELSILAINTLRQDCNDTDPMVRGLALRGKTQYSK